MKTTTMKITLLLLMTFVSLGVFSQTKIHVTEDRLKTVNGQTLLGTGDVTISVTGKADVDGNNATGTWPISITGSAPTLTTPRTIALSGAATGTATSFNGSANITIPVTALNATNLTAGTVPFARLPTGTTSSTVAVGNHLHALGDLTNVTLTTPSNGQFLKYNGTNWVNSSESIPTQINPTAGTGISITGTYPNLTFTNSSPNATHTGDVTGSTALTIANSAVTNAKLANVATSTIKGRVSASTGVVEDLTAAQVRTLLNVESGATANQSDAYLLNRSNHTGTQAQSTITGLSTDLSARVLKAGDTMTGNLTFNTNTLGIVLRDSESGSWRIGITTDGQLTATKLP